MTYTFTVSGNQENALANPVPYHRTTQGSTWTKEAKRYNAWKNYVRHCFYKQTDAKVQLLEPITLSKTKTATMDIAIEWANGTHGDCDNVFKGIADALFTNDKYIMAGSFKSTYSKSKQGKVYIAITIHG